MKKIVCFLVLTIITTGYPQVPDFAVRRPGPSYAMPSKQADSHETGTPYFVYGGVHFMGGVPMGGAGIRLRKETHCLDFSGYTCLLYFPRAVSVFHLRGLCLFYPNQQGFEFKPDFLPHHNELVIEKSIPCAMLTTDLETILDQKNIRKLVLAGASTNNSIEATARTASGLGFSVFVVEDACFAFAKKDYFGTARTAADVHAMSLANLKDEYAQVVNSERLLA